MQRQLTLSGDLASVRFRSPFPGILSAIRSPNRAPKLSTREEETVMLEVYDDGIEFIQNVRTDDPVHLLLHAVRDVFKVICHQDRVTVPGHCADLERCLAPYCVADPA